MNEFKVIAGVNYNVVPSSANEARGQRGAIKKNDHM
jgi:hypothetical protein